MDSERRLLAAGAGQRGVVAVEFALVIAPFLLLLFATIEIAHGMYLWNTVQEVTRAAARGAAMADFSSAAAMDAVRRQAIFRSTPGTLLLGGSIDQRYVRIDYLSLGGGGTLLPVTALPGCPQQNVVNCTRDPHGASCVRFVRARLCLPDGAGTCTGVPYQALLPIPLLDGLFEQNGTPISLPSSDTVAPAESLGYLPGQPAC